MVDYEVMVLILSPFTISLLVLVGWLIYKSTKNSKELCRVKDRLEVESRRHRDERRRSIRLETEKQELMNKLEANIKVGTLFYPPNNDRWVEDFGGTTQKITSVNHEDLTFASKDVNSNKRWKSTFDQAKDFLWGHNSNNMKHKFV